MLYHIALGCNLGNRTQQLQSALVHLQRLGAIQAKSCVYDTAPMYVTDQPAFANAVVALRTPLTPRELMAALHRIERAHGRVRTQPNGPRTLDLDIVDAESLQLDEPDLQIPHPRLAERPFVVFPLLDIAPHWTHPATGSTIEQLADSLQRPPVLHDAADW
jgi:2-amino-4-hydroxy-6-hydroxymethyldihydropteridine diphosphokinase